MSVLPNYYSTGTVSVAASVLATSTYTESANFVAADTITIGGVVYTFVTSIGSTPGNVLIGGTVALSLGYLAAAINNNSVGGTPGVDYIAQTAGANPYVSAVATATTLVVTALPSLTAAVANAVGTVRGGTSEGTWGTATLTGGIDTTAVTGVGTSWTAFVSAGDILWINGISCRILSVTDNTDLVLAFKWPGPAALNMPYEIQLPAPSSDVTGGLRALVEGLVSGFAGPIVGTQPAGNNTTYAASTAFVNTAVASLAGRNRLINGDFRVSQYNGTSSVTPTASAYVIDRWYYDSSIASKFTIGQNLNGVATPGGVSDSYLGFQTNAAVTVGSTDYFYLLQPLEGVNFADFGFGLATAQAVSLSFWVYSSLTGTFGGSLTNYAGTRSYPFTYSIAAANTWTKIVITIPGDTSGTWIGATTTGAAALNFGLGVGTTHSGTAGTWASANYFSATGAKSVVLTLSATFYITDVQLEMAPSGATSAAPDSTAFERLNYGAQLALCQQYYQPLSYVAGSRIALGMYYASQNIDCACVSIPVTMRASPTVTVPSFGTSAGNMQFSTPAFGAPGGTGTNGVNASNPNNVSFYGTAYTGITGTIGCSSLGSAGGCTIVLNAEL